MRFDVIDLQFEIWKHFSKWNRCDCFDAEMNAMKTTWNEQIKLDYLFSSIKKCEMEIFREIGRSVFVDMKEKEQQNWVFCLPEEYMESFLLWSVFWWNLRFFANKISFQFIFTAKSTQEIQKWLRSYCKRRQFDVRFSILSKNSSNRCCSTAIHSIL